MPIVGGLAAGLGVGARAVPARVVGAVQLIFCFLHYGTVHERGSREVGLLLFCILVPCRKVGAEWGVRSGTVQLDI